MENKQSVSSTYPRKEKTRYIMASIFALGFGLLAALIWFGFVVITGWEVGFIAMVVGYLVGTGVHLGSGKRSGPRLSLLAAGFTLLAIFFGQYLITNHQLYQYLTQSYSGPYPYFLPSLPVLDLLFNLIIEHPFTLVFWIIAVLFSISIPSKKKES